MSSLSRPRHNGRSLPAIAGAAVIRIAARYNATAERVFNAWLNPGIARRWLFATAARPIAQVEIDSCVAGAFRFVERRGDSAVEHTGHYVEIVPHRRLVFSLALGDRPRVLTRVSVELEPRRNGCRLTLAHENVPSDRMQATEARWTGILYGLGATLDSLGGKRMSELRPLAPGPDPQRFALAQASVRRDPLPLRNPRSE